VISEFNITIKSGDGCPRLFMPTLYVVVLGVNRIGKVNSTPKDWEVMVVMDWSMGFWQVMVAGIRDCQYYKIDGSASWFSLGTDRRE
jgi:hypothetical protein